MTSNYLNPFFETVFFSACCGLTHLVVYFVYCSWAHKAMFTVFVVCYKKKKKKKKVSSSLAKTSRSHRLCSRWVHFSGPVLV